MEKDRFNDLIKEKLGNINLIIVSNREPTAHEYVGKKIKAVKSVGGLTIALEPILKNLHGTWIAYGGGGADKVVVDSGKKIKLPEGEESYTLKRVFLTKKDLNDYYYGYSNSVLWPLSHTVYVKPVFNSDQFLAYDEVNRKFADSIIEEIKERSDKNGISSENIIWLQDYHLAMCAKYLKEYDNELKTSIFWHIPWPNPEIFSICPEKTKLLEGLLSNDLIGFHIIYHCQNFLRSCEWELEAQVNWADYSITYKGHKTKVMPFPISIDAVHLNHIAMSEKVDEIIDETQKNDEIIEPPYEYLAVSVDRLDYTKGIIEKLMAIDKLLERHPELIGKFVFVQFGVLSRVHIEAYKKFNDEIFRLSDDINWKYGTSEWYPIVRYFKQLDLEVYMAYYRLCDVMIATPLHDGMNLVAKEFIMSDTDYKGMLILSRFAGAAKELYDSLLVNPYDSECFAGKIYEGIMMDKEEKKKRVSKMQNIILENDIYDWAYNFLTALYLI
ncbi:alpha,alpha-trehalose-phosphate synthase (UDP-forming) [Candidatus Acidulodesulfobacterium sp. H_13]|uniref:alpha,alpha-trehalose-phosphate synthase (UDP-forming) n=1 Tax=Candidatus Acidulodesulfobacterium sp. H_13 TaxID=3395470 RepID=UPI003AF6BF40